MHRKRRQTQSEKIIFYKWTYKESASVKSLQYLILCKYISDM